MELEEIVERLYESYEDDVSVTIDASPAEVIEGFEVSYVRKSKKRTRFFSEGEDGEIVYCESAELPDSSDLSYVTVYRGDPKQRELINEVSEIR